jgi:uncharacterized protein (TIGR02594 family)
MHALEQALPRWFLHAQTFERAGIIEVAGPKAHPTILSFFNYTTLKNHPLAKTDETAWCSAFICAIMEQCDIRSSKSAAARSWLGWGEALQQPRIGCVVVLDRADANNKSAAHVGLWAGHIDDKHFALLGGNQSNKVCTKLYKYADVQGYRWPIGEEHA